jgi:cell division protein FtsA
MSERIITAIDLGSSKICVIIALLHENKKFEIKGLGVCESKGIENGLVRDLQKTAESISKAVSVAEEAAGLSAENIFVAISGQHIKNRNTEGVFSVAIGNQPSEIDQNHVASVINDAKNKIKSEGGSERLEILHCIPQVYDIDSQKGILNPIGMSGYSITVHTHIILAETSHLRNIRKAFEMAELSEPTIVLGSIATVEAISDEDERRLGCVIFDIGEGTSDLLIYQNSYLKKYLCVPIGGSLITHDLAIGLRTPPSFAENIKIDHGNAIPASIRPDLTTEVESIGGRAPQIVALSFISEITQLRLIDILERCYRELLSEFTKLDTLTAGVVLTGGTSLVNNIHHLIEEQRGFNLPCRVAYPDLRKLSGAISVLNNPMFSCVVGLLYYAMSLETIKPSKQKPSKILNNTNQFFKNIIKKISEL